jgi:ParB/RepB/Spo0J family partition protein
MATKDKNLSVFTERLAQGFETMPKTSEQAGMKILHIDVNKILPNPDQPRTIMDEQETKNLAANIVLYGLQNPIRVRQNATTEEGAYILVNGQRRLAACKLIGWKQIPATLSSGDTPFIESVIENLQREDLHPLDEAACYRRLIDEFNMLQREIAEKIAGKSESYVSEMLNLLTLHPTILEKLRKSEALPSKSVLLELGRMSNQEIQLACWPEVEAQRATVASLRAHAEELRGQSKEPERLQGHVAPTVRLLSSMKRVAAYLDTISKEQSVMTTEQRSELRELHKQINASFKELFKRQQIHTADNSITDPNGSKARTEGLDEDVDEAYDIAETSDIRS